MKLKTWIQIYTDDTRQQMAASAQTSVGYLRQIAGKHKSPSWQLAVRIEKATKKLTPKTVVTVAELLPDLAKRFG